MNKLEEEDIMRLASLRHKAHCRNGEDEFNIESSKYGEWTEIIEEIISILENTEEDEKAQKIKELKNEMELMPNSQDDLDEEEYEDDYDVISAIDNIIRDVDDIIISIINNGAWEDYRFTGLAKPPKKNKKRKWGEPR